VSRPIYERCETCGAERDELCSDPIDGGRIVLYSAVHAGRQLADPAPTES
jgi:hypothetical protein